VIGRALHDHLRQRDRGLGAVADIGVVIGQLARLVGDGLGHLLTAVADIHAIEPGEGVEEAVAVPVLMKDPSADLMIRVAVSPRACWARWVEGWMKLSRSHFASWSFVSMASAPRRIVCHKPTGMGRPTQGTASDDQDS
jgi:hypothetical protein